MERRDLTIQHDGLDFHVTEWGAMNASPIIMLHGIRGFGETFFSVAQALQPEYRVIAIDQRGRGQSDWDPNRNYYTDTYVSDLAAIASKLGLEQFDLLGHSMGGINAIVFASKFPHRVKKLIIEDAGPGAFESSAGASRIQEELKNTPEKFNSWDEASDFMRRLRPSVTEEARQQRLKSMLKPVGKENFTWQYDHAGISGTRLNPDPNRIIGLSPHVAAIASKTLLLRGSRTDYLQPEMAQKMCDLNPLIVCKEIKDAGHYIHDDQPTAFNQLVREFLINKDIPNDL